MEFVPIFGDEKSPIYATKYDGESTDAFQRLMEEWRDVEFLYHFFSENEKDLHGESIEESVEIVIDQANDFEDTFLDILETDSSDQKEKLEQLFRPLNKIISPYDKPFPQKKAYGRKKWLRIYALHVDDDFYIITGGAIKLTGTMQEGKHTENELRKLMLVRSVLIEEGISDKEAVIGEIDI